jgi:hypothetical protein
LVKFKIGLSRLTNHLSNNIYSLSGIEILTEVIFVIYSTFINYYIHKFQDFELAQGGNPHLSFGTVLIRMVLGFFKKLKNLKM